MSNSDVRVARVRARAVVVFGVSGSGKSTVAAALAERCVFDYCDADDLHPAANIYKMGAGHPLNDEDRWPWLDTVGRRLSDALNDDRGIVVACSALKRRYRDLLRTHEPTTFFVFLDGTQNLIMPRVLARHQGFMPPSLLASQFDALDSLQSDEAGVRIDVSQELVDTVDEAMVALQ